VRFLRSLGVWIVISVATVLFGLPAIPLALVPPRGEWFLKLARGWARLILAVSGVSVRARHLERLEARASFVIAPNHESFYDILVLLAVLPVSVRFLAKRNLFRLPILGWSMAAAGFIPVDRETRSRSFALVDAALARLGGGRSLIVFPEETRTRTGELSPFKGGAALLALRSELPLLPVGIAGTFEIQRRGGFTIRPSRVCLAIGEPIATAGRQPRDRAALTGELRERVALLRAQARADIESPAEDA
jgi:1-acyl-sn-glycerol-3-phosphate acyltransferase